MKKRLRRTMLRVASKDEEAFRETFGVFEAFYRIGLRPNDLSVTMVPRDNACSPAVVVKQGGHAVTYRIDNHIITGTQAQCERRWREWVITLVGDEPDLPQRVRDDLFQKSPFASPEAQAKLVDMLKANGIVPSRLQAGTK
jgi:hypothetical protein